MAGARARGRRAQGELCGKFCPAGPPPSRQPPKKIMDPAQRKAAAASAAGGDGGNANSGAITDPATGSPGGKKGRGGSRSGPEPVGALPPLLARHGVVTEQPLVGKISSTLSVLRELDSYGCGTKGQSGLKNRQFRQGPRPRADRCMCRQMLFQVNRMD